MEPMIQAEGPHRVPRHAVISTNISMSRPAKAGIAPRFRHKVVITPTVLATINASLISKVVFHLQAPGTEVRKRVGRLDPTRAQATAKAAVTSS